MMEDRRLGTEDGGEWRKSAEDGALSEGWCRLRMIEDGRPGTEDGGEWRRMPHSAPIKNWDDVP